MISNNLIQIKMSYYCECCDKSIKLKSKNKHFKPLTHKQYEKFIQINHTIQRPKSLM